MAENIGVLYAKKMAAANRTVEGDFKGEEVAVEVLEWDDKKGLHIKVEGMADLWIDPSEFVPCQALDQTEMVVWYAFTDAATKG